MALAAADVFAAFDVTDGAQDRDISVVLEDAIFYDTNLLGHANVDFNNPVYDIVHYWNEEELNPDTVTLSASYASDATAIPLTTGQGSRTNIGDILYSTASGIRETMQITATAADQVTVTRSYGAAAAVSSASTATHALIRVEQEGSNIGRDKTLNPTVRNNYTQIFAAKDLLISGTQLARKMATNEYRDFLARQLAARATEMKIGMSRALLYSEKSSITGSDSVYRAFDGLFGWATAAGVTNASSEAISLAVLNAHNKTAVDLGLPPDTLVVGTDLVSTIAGFEASTRRLRESDTGVGYWVNEIQLAQGNVVTVVPDTRVRAGEAFLFKNSKVCMRPMSGRGMFVIAAVDFADAKKRRLLGEWTVEVRHPQALVYLSNKT